MSKLIDENGVATLIELVKKQTPNTYSKQEIDALVNQNRVSVDGSLSTSSPNPVSNRVVTSELSKKLNSTSVAQVAVTGSYNDLKDKPALEEAVPLHIRSITQLDITNWNNKQDVISDLETIRNKANSAILTMPNFATVATSGSYDDLTGKPTIPDTSNLATKLELSNYCPIIEDTRTVAVATITGNAPFSELVDGQRIIIRFALITANNSSIQLNLSSEESTGAIPAFVSSYFVVNTQRPLRRMAQYDFSGSCCAEFVYNKSNNRWVCLTQIDTAPKNMYPSLLIAGTEATGYAISPQLLRNNFYLKSETDNLVANKQNKRVVETPTITADWAYNDYGMPFTAQNLGDALDAYYADWRNEANAVTLCNALVAGNGMQDVELSRAAHSAFIYVGGEFDASGEYDSFYSENSVKNNPALTPTNYVVFGRTDSLAPAIADVDYTEADEFLFSFVCSTDNCSLTLPSDVNYGNGLDFDTDKKADRKFQVSISDGIALYAYVDPQNS